MRAINRKFITIILTALFLLGSHSASASGQVVKLNDGLEAEVVSVSRNKLGYLTVTFNLSNSDKKNVAYLMYLSVPKTSASTNTGGVYALNKVSPVLWCRTHTSVCLGENGVVNGTPSLQMWTKLDPERTQLVTVVLFGGRNSGPVMSSFSASFAYRIVSDTMRDSTLSDSQKRKQINMLPVSFGPASITDES